MNIPYNIQTFIDHDLYNKFKEKAIENGCIEIRGRLKTKTKKSIYELRVELFEKALLDYIGGQ